MLTSCPYKGNNLLYAWQTSTHACLFPFLPIPLNDVHKEKIRKLLEPSHEQTWPFLWLSTKRKSFQVRWANLNLTNSSNLNARRCCKKLWSTLSIPLFGCYDEVFDCIWWSCDLFWDQQQCRTPKSLSKKEKLIMYCADNYTVKRLLIESKIITPK